MLDQSLRTCVRLPNFALRAIAAQEPFACFLNPSSWPGRTVICALISKAAMETRGAILLLLTDENFAEDAARQSRSVVWNCGIVHGEARNNPRFPVRPA